MINTLFVDFIIFPILFNLLKLFRILDKQMITHIISSSSKRCIFLIPILIATKKTSFFWINEIWRRNKFILERAFSFSNRLLLSRRSPLIIQSSIIVWCNCKSPCYRFFSILHVRFYTLGWWNLRFSRLLVSSSKENYVVCFFKNITRFFF